MEKIIFIVLISTSFFALAEEKSPGERMMLSMGVDKLLVAQREAYRVDAEKQVGIIMKQLTGVLSQLPKETSTELQTIMNTMTTNLLNSWDVETAIQVYSAQWNENYKPEEIEEVIEKMEDPAAKKEVEVMMAATEALNQYLSTSYNTAMERSMAGLMPRIQQAIIKGKKEMQSKKASQPTTEAPAD